MSVLHILYSKEKIANNERKAKITEKTLNKQCKHRKILQFSLRLSNVSIIWAMNLLFYFFTLITAKVF